MLVGKFSKKVPAFLVAGGAALVYCRVVSSPQTSKRKELIKSISVLTGTIGSALIATRGIGCFNGLSGKINIKKIENTNAKIINDFLSNDSVGLKTKAVLEKAKNKILTLSEIKVIFGELSKNKRGKEFLNKLIPSPENVDSKHIFGEIKRLSLLGLVPVLGGIAGGILGDRLTEREWKDRIPNKIKEGVYQYLANIFLCNIGAGIALMLLEKAKVTSKSARATGMLTGILAVGVFGGSIIANFIGKNIINPLLKEKYKNVKKDGKSLSCENNNCPQNRKFYSERKPEALDIGLHMDDIATVAVLSGLKWIEPALPILYSVSGYRAGIGYRNGD